MATYDTDPPAPCKAPDMHATPDEDTADQFCAHKADPEHGLEIKSQDLSLEEPASGPASKVRGGVVA